MECIVKRGVAGVCEFFYFFLTADIVIHGHVLYCIYSSGLL